MEKLLEINVILIVKMAVESFVLSHKFNFFSPKKLQNTKFGVNKDIYELMVRTNGAFAYKTGTSKEQ
jgi:hypothetical protein